MKKLYSAVLAAILVATGSLPAQQPFPPVNQADQDPAVAVSRAIQNLEAIKAANAAAAPRGQPVPRDELYTFDLDFPGGTPGELVRAIQNQPARLHGENANVKVPLNAIIPEDCASLQLSPIKVKNVNVPELFTALNRSSIRNFQVQDFKGGPTTGWTQSFAFTTEGPNKNDCVWSFSQMKPIHPAPNQRVECRFYQLGPYLETYKVEDITTAIETGWRMMMQHPGPDGPTQGLSGPSGETIRPGEERRITAEVQYLNSRTLYERLTNMPATELEKVLPTVAPDPELTTLLGGLHSINQREVMLEVQFSPQHPEVIQAKAVAAEIQKQLDVKIQGVLAGMGVQVEHAKRQFELIVKEFNEAKQRDLDLGAASLRESLPQISFHKDTKLLIAVGDPAKLQLIDDVLQHLEQGKHKLLLQSTIDSSNSNSKSPPQP